MLLGLVLGFGAWTKDSRWVQEATLPARNVLGASFQDGELNFMPTAMPLKAKAERERERSSKRKRPRRQGQDGVVVGDRANCGIVTGRRPRSTCTLVAERTQDSHSRTHTHTFVRERVHELATAAKLHLKFYFHGRGSNATNKNEPRSCL